MSYKEKQLSHRAITGGQGERIGLWGWLSLYVSGTLLLFFAIAHILVIHFFSAEKITTSVVKAHYGSAYLTVISLGLLFIGLTHSLIGFRRVVLDLEIFGRKGDRIFIWILVATGVILAFFGLSIFKGFVSLP